MTKPQIWVAAVLILFFALYLLEMNTKRSDEQVKPKPTGVMQQQQQTTQVSANQPPTQIVANLGCTGCHGGDLSGTQMAPSLHSVKDNWSRDGLINYLRNPQSYMSSKRFQEFKAKYPNAMMPSFNNIDVKVLGKVSDYLMSLSK